MSPEKPWKRHERSVAKKLGGRRVPLSGAPHFPTSADVDHATFYVECKYRTALAMFTWWRQVEARAQGEGKTPLLVLKEKGMTGELAVITLDLFTRLSHQAGLDSPPPPDLPSP